MGLFSFFFKNKKKSKSYSKPRTIVEVNINSSTNISDNEIDDTYSRIFMLNSEEIRITEVNKLISNTYKDNGFDKAKNLFQTFWNENNNKFELIDAHRFVNNYINILKSEKFQSEEIVNFINDKFKQYPESNNYEYVLLKAKMLKKFDLQKSLEYLKNQNAKEELKISNREVYVEAIYLESQYLLSNTNFDDAFQNLGKTAMVIPHFDQHNYLRWSQKISSLNAKICYKEKKPKYDSYLYFEITSFLLDVLVQISSFPHCYNFYRLKQEYKTSDWPFEEDKNFDKALESLNMLTSKNDLILELKEFAFFQLPRLYGIPKEYDSYEQIERVTNRDSDNYDGWYELSKISERLQAKFADKEVIAIHSFVQDLTNKYSKRSINV